MSSKRTRLLRVSSAILLSAGLGACATAEPPKTVSDVSCAAFSTISYAQLAQGLVDDAGNRADSDETVRQIEAHNARHDALCGDPLAPPG